MRPGSATPPPALVIDGDGRAALAVVRSLGRRGIPVTVSAATRCSLAGASRHASRRIELPDAAAEPDALAEALSGLAQREPGSVWFPVTDVSLAVVDAARDRLGRVHLPIASREALALAWDKSRTLELANSLGVATPRTWMPERSAEVHALARELEYPIVIKPRRSRWPTQSGFVAGPVVYAHSPEALVSAWESVDAQIPAPLVQERVPGYGMGLFVLADHGEVRIRFAHRRLREKPPSGGVSVLSESIQVPPELQAAADRLVAALRWHGVCMIEFKVDARDGRPLLMELNPRLWGSLELAIAAGVDFPWLLYQLALGEPLPPQPAYHLGVRSRWELGDLDHLLIRLRGRDGNLAPGAPSRLGALLAFLDPFAGRPEVFKPSDPGPGWHELRHWVKGLVGARAQVAAGDLNPRPRP
jgi:predicted ATP-grasp superfamily ATP-dependent carboligase